MPLRRSCGGLARSAEAPNRLPNTWRRTEPHPQRDEDNGSCKCNCRQLREQLPAHNPHPQVGTHVQTRHRRSWLGGAGGTGPKRRAAVRCPAHQGCAETADEAPGKDLSIQVSLAETHTHTHTLFVPAATEHRRTRTCPQTHRLSRGAWKRLRGRRVRRRDWEQDRPGQGPPGLSPATQEGGHAQSSIVVKTTRQRRTTRPSTES